ncbi:MAG: antitoxin Xre/MbcA/ParS toxin-binding domain-containing protein [Mycobacteriales bacterium]
MSQPPTQLRSPEAATVRARKGTVVACRCGNELRGNTRSLRSVYADEGIEIWLHARNRNLGGQRPIDLLTAGDVESVIGQAQRLAGAM